MASQRHLVLARHRKWTERLLRQRAVRTGSGAGPIVGERDPRIFPVARFGSTIAGTDQCGLGRAHIGHPQAEHPYSLDPIVKASPSGLLLPMTHSSKSPAVTCVDVHAGTGGADGRRQRSATEADCRETDGGAPSSKLEALRSTSVIAGASAITIIIRMVRTKVLAVLLGPAGVGLEAIYDSVLTLVRTLFDLGMSNSGVRQIAASSASGDRRRIAATIFTLHRVCLVLGILGSVTLFLGREYVSRLAFNNADHATAFGWLAIIVLIGAVAAAQGALLQGLRRMGDLARTSIIGTALGAAVSVPIVLVWGRDGIPAYMVLSAAIGVLVSWHFTRRIETLRVTLPFGVVAQEARGLFTLGFAFMISALIVAATTFLLRALVTHKYGVEGAGQFQAASALSLVYIGFILQAMGTDFYPRLTAVAHDNDQCNRTVNDQAEVSLLMALPGILATLGLAPWVIWLLYSASFVAAAEVLAWQMGGMLLRVVSWPLGFVVMARGHGTIFVATEAISFSLYIVLAWAGLQWFGLAGVGMAFMGMYILYVVMMYGVVRKLTGFRWSPSYQRYASAGLAIGLLALWVRLHWPEPWATLVPLLLAGIAAIHSLRQLIRIIGRDRVERILSKLRLAWVVRMLQDPWRNPAKAAIRSQLDG